MTEFDAAIKANRANWDDRADVHVASPFYDVERFVSDPTTTSEVVDNDLAVLAPHLDGGTVKGKSLLHLQCHIGLDTVCWWRRGALDVHGLDFSPNSLAHARRIAERAGADITYVESDARTASNAINRTFDVVVTSAGTIVWLPELTAWARSIHELLEPGGVFMIRDDHPILGALAYQPWKITGNYLSDGGPSVYEDDATYTGDDPQGRIRHTVNHEWRHDLAEVAGALLDAGLLIESLGEHPIIDWPAFDTLVPVPTGWTLPEGAPRIPLTFSIVARRPKAPSL